MLARSGTPISGHWFGARELGIHLDHTLHSNDLLWSEISTESGDTSSAPPLVEVECDSVTGLGAVGEFGQASAEFVGKSESLDESASVPDSVNVDPASVDIPFARLHNRPCFLGWLETHLSFPLA